MNYKEQLIRQNGFLGLNPKTRFIGYGLKKGRALGTLKEVRDDQIIEMPVAENLMVGVATGLALQGYLSVVFIERMDFLLNALDQIVNHLDKIKQLSKK
jgi:pyruvate/2-oxoglutarate/acetoin dehydrogenase E1 component